MTGTGQRRGGRTTRGRRGPLRTLIKSLVLPDSFASILLLLVVTYVLIVTLDPDRAWTSSLILLVQVFTVVLVLRVASAHPVLRATARVALALALVVGFANLFGSGTGWLGAFVFAVASLLYLIAPVAILRAILARPQVDRETLFGAFDAYLLIGFFFAFAYRTIAVAQGGPFFGSAGDGTLSRDMFFSFTTLTTTGYGNYVPARNPGQTFAVLEMLVGQLFLITAVAKVINAWSPRRSDRAPQTPA